MKQFKMAIRDAMASKTEVRAMMRARSALQRFPVAQWVEDLGTLQSKSIELHEKYSSANSSLLNSTSAKELALPHPIDGVQSSASSVYSVQSSANRIMSSSWFGPGRKNSPPSTQPPTAAPSRVGSSLFADSRRASENNITGAVSGKQRNRLSKPRKTGRVVFSAGGDDDESDDDDMASPQEVAGHDSYGMSALPLHSRNSSRGSTYPVPTVPSLRQLQNEIVDAHGNPSASSLLDPCNSGTSSPNPPFASRSRAASMLSLASVDAVIGERKDFKLQAVDPFFTDATGVYGGTFDTMLNSLDGKTSEDQLCIEDYLKKSEKQWYSRLNDAKLGISPSVTVSMFHWGNKSASSLSGNESRPDLTVMKNGDNSEFGLSDNHVVPTGIKRIMQLKIGDWPVYAFVLAFVGSTFRECTMLANMS